MSIGLGHYLSVGAILFALSVIGIFLNRKNLIVLLMCIELMLLAVNLNFVAFSHYLPVVADKMPEQGKLAAERLGYFIRAGKHSMTPDDWKVFTDYADKWLK